MSAAKVSSSPGDWREVHTNWEDKMQFIISNQFGCDVALRIREGDKYADFKAHQFVLNMSSVLFEKLLQDSRNRVFDPAIKMTVLNLPNTNSQFFKLFLRFLYTRKIQLESFTDAYELYKLSKQYGITDLNSMCLHFISNTVAISNALEVKEFATNYNIDSLREECSNIIRINTAEVLKMSKWKLEWIKSLLDEPELSITEIELFKLVETWINTYFGDLDNTVHRNYLWKTLIHKFCFLNMTADEFLEGPVKTGMISKDESLAIIGHIVSEKKFHLPFPSSFKKTKRRITGQQESAMILPKLSPNPVKGSDKQSKADIQASTCQGSTGNGTELVDKTETLRLKIQSISHKSKEKVDEAQQTSQTTKSSETNQQEKPLDRKHLTSPAGAESKPLQTFHQMTDPLPKKLPSQSTIEDDLERAHNFIKKTSFGELNKKRMSVLECNKSELKSKNYFDEVVHAPTLSSIVESQLSSSNTINSQEDKPELSKSIDLNSDNKPAKARGKIVIKEVKKGYDQMNLQTLKKPTGPQSDNTKNKASAGRSSAKPATHLQVRKKSPNRNYPEK
ncbi:uncharacterized protein LOC106669552 [Cimex lectularius]|uniref:BTB domain-containing protein n=1 Tax=Cimex lectularius TaxID=79782 RepID=A0A8I6TJ93_CIMLE|nr:uncharacterized protein LOC106669552 [Cimex lectularius]